METRKKQFRIELVGLTDAGTVKTINEDSMFYDLYESQETSYAICAVADGVGGLEKGELASSLAIERIRIWWEQEVKNHLEEKQYLIQTLVNTVQQANSELVYLATEQGIHAATTLSVLFLYQDEIITIHIGDSRIYRYRNKLFQKGFEQLTTDHSCYILKTVGNRIVRKSVLTECLGHNPTCNHESKVFEVKDGDVLITCSDGIYKTMKEGQLAHIIAKNKKDLNNLCQVLVQTVKRNGETDNISVVAIRIHN